MYDITKKQIIILIYCNSKQDLRWCSLSMKHGNIVWENPWKTGFRVFLVDDAAMWKIMSPQLNKQYWETGKPVDLCHFDIDVFERLTAAWIAAALLPRVKTSRDDCSQDRAFEKWMQVCFLDTKKSLHTHWLKNTQTYNYLFSTTSSKSSSMGYHRPRRTEICDRSFSPTYLYDEKTLQIPLVSTSISTNAARTQGIILQN